MIVKSIVVAIAAVLLAFGMIRQREFRVNRLWIQPVVVSIILLLGLYGSSLSPSVLTMIVLGVCVGGGTASFEQRYQWIMSMSVSAA